MESIREAFGKAAKSVTSKDTYRTPSEWENKGITTFKEEILGGDFLGFGKYEAIKSLDELANILVKMGVVDSVDSGRDFIPKLYKNSIGERLIDYEHGGLVFTEIQNKEGTKLYRIRKHEDRDIP